MLEVIAWEILVLGGFCAFLAAKSRAVQALVLIAVLGLGATIFGQGQSIRNATATAQQQLETAQTIARTDALLEQLRLASPEQAMGPGVSDPGVKAWLDRRVTPDERDAALADARKAEGHR